MRIKIYISFFCLLLLFGCAGATSKGFFGTGVSIAMDPRTLGTQIDDSIINKSIGAKLLIMNKNYILNVKTTVLDGRVFITGKVNTPEEKLKITKLAWETKGIRSVKNNLKIKEDFNFKQSAKDILITSQLKSAMIFNDQIKAANYNIDTYKRNIYIYGIARDENEKSEILREAKEINDVENIIESILLVEDLRVVKN